MFSDWLFGLDYKFKYEMLVGATAVCWAIWTTRNEIVFDNCTTKTYMQVLYRPHIG